MANPSPSSGRIEEHFSLPLFLFTIVVSLAGLVGLQKLVAPDFVWRAQLGATWWRFAAAFLAIHLFNSFVEFVFHRYVLHKPVVPFLSRFYKQHTLHHSLTRIGKRYTAAGREVPFVENIYPVIAPEQGEASFFPWYTLAVFAGIVTPLLAFLQWLAPAFPWFFAGFAALAFSLSLYEIFHAIEHWAFERWAPLIEHRRFGWFWRKVYSFHLRHHAVIDCNEAISGFFTLPVFDWAFGTFVLPQSLYADGSAWTATEFASPRPVALIRWLDLKSDELVRRRRERAHAPAGPAPVYTRGEQIAHHLTHGTGLLASIAALALLVTFAALRGSAWHVTACTVFGATLVFGYAAFLNLRRTRETRQRQPFSRRNHIAVLLLIAGTATPFLLVNLRGPWGWSLFGVVWGICGIGALLRLFRGSWVRAISTFAYLALALVALVALKPVIAAVPAGALWLLFAGVVCYACGSIFHLWQRLHYHQAARHAFALGGSACHLIAVLLFVLPR